MSIHSRNQIYNTTAADTSSPPKSRFTSPISSSTIHISIDQIIHLYTTTNIHLLIIMGFFKRVVGFLGFSNHEVNKDSGDENNNNNLNNSTEEEMHHYIDPNLPRKGFSVSVQVPVDKAHQIGPILVPCPDGDGGVQVISLILF